MAHLPLGLVICRHASSHYQPKGEQTQRKGRAKDDAEKWNQSLDLTTFEHCLISGLFLLDESSSLYYVNPNLLISN